MSESQSRSCSELMEQNQNRNIGVLEQPLSKTTLGHLVMGVGSPTPSEHTRISEN